MISSITLLLALQAFWLTNSYEKAYHDLRRETGGLFRSTVLALRDSSLRRQLVHVKDAQIERASVIVSRIYNTHKESIDTLVKGSGQIKIFITTDRENPDSINAMVDPLTSGIRDGKLRKGQNFILRMNGDSLSIDSIRNHFNHALADIRISVPFEIRRSSFLPPDPTHNVARIFRRSNITKERLVDVHPFSNEMSSDWITVDPLHRYSAHITDFRAILIKNILPQILFSFFLTVVTVAAFNILLRSLRAQQRLVTMKNDFISNITHELKTPIATVSVALEALKSFNGIDNPVRTQEYLDIAQHELNRLSTLTDKVLKASLFDEKGVKLDVEKVDLEKVVEEIINSMSLNTGKSKITIDFKKTGGDFIVNGSLVHLTNVIYNLIDNAIKYSPSDPELLVELQYSGNSLSLSITDKGIGIPEEFHDKIFEKFFRIPTGNVHTIKGYGLGLSYVESIVRAHEGKISIISELGKGSSFRIFLPRRKS